MAHTIDDLAALAEKETTVNAGAIAAINGLRAALKDALGKELSPAGQAKLDKVFDKITENADALVAAVNVNTPDENAGGHDDTGIVEEFKSLPAEPLV